MGEWVHSGCLRATSLSRGLVPEEAAHCCLNLAKAMTYATDMNITHALRANV